MSELRYRSSEKWTIFRTIHIIVGIIIIVMSIIAFIDPDDNRLAFPAIFAMASFLNFLAFYKAVRSCAGDRKQVFVGFLNGLIGLFLLIVSIIALISL